MNKNGEICGVWIPKKLRARIKVYAAKNDILLQEALIELLDFSLKKFNRNKK